jgi:hypothetical protein
VENFSENILYPKRESKPGSPEYRVEVLRYATFDRQEVAAMVQIIATYPIILLSLPGRIIVVITVVLCLTKYHVMKT